MLGRFSPLTSPVARLPRILFSVLCSPGALPRPCIEMRARKRGFWYANGAFGVVRT